MANRVSPQDQVFLSEGRVAGDFHYQNMAARRSGEKQKVDFMDLDDGGRGPFLFDLVRFLVTNQAVFVRVPNEQLVDAYIQGLEGSKSEKPWRIKKLSDLSFKKIEDGEANYVEKNRRGDDLHFERLGLSRLKESPVEVQKLAQTVAESLAKRFDGHVLSIGTRRKTVGGSQGFLRVWVLLKTKDGDRIFEAKEIGEPALSAWAPQQGFAVRINDLIQVFWGDHPEAYGVMTIDSQNFWFRPRGPKFFRTDFPDGREQDDADTYRDEMLAFANYLGRRHGRQDEAEAYREAVTGRSDDFRQWVQLTTRDYLQNSHDQFANQYAP